MRFFIAIILLFSFSQTISAQESVWNVIADSTEYSTFKEMVLAVGADEWLQNNDSLSILAPYNDAIDSSFTEEELETLMLNIDDALLDFVHDHIVLKDTFIQGNLTEYTTYYGSKNYVFIDGAGNHIIGGEFPHYAYLDFSNVQTTDNGTVYGVYNGALQISNDAPAEILGGNQILYNAIWQSSYFDTLYYGTETYTILVPPEDSTLAQIEDIDLSIPEVRDSFVSAHIFSGHYRIQDLYDGLSLETWSESILEFEITDSLTQVNGIDIVMQCPTQKGVLLFLGDAPEHNPVPPEPRPLFAPIGAKWYFPETYFNSPNIGLVTFTSIEDDIIQGENVRVIYKDNATCNGNDGNYFTLEKNDSLFLFNPNNQAFELQWIYNSEIGDSWEIYQTDQSIPDTLTCLVDSLSMYELPNGKFTTVQHVTLTSRYFEILETEIYEHFGFTNSLFPNELISICDGDFEGSLRCYEDDEIGLINFSNVGCLFTPVSNLENSHTIKVFPNPASTMIYIESDAPITELRVMNTKGELVFHQEGDLKSFQCDSFLPGIYFTYLITKSGTKVHKLVIE